jgi:Glycosyl transferases group 1
MIRRRLEFTAKAVLHLTAAPVTVLLCLVLAVPVSRARRWSRRRRGEKPAILWAPLPIIQVRYQSLADRLYGYRSDTLVYKVYHINSRDDFDYPLDRLYSIPVLGSLVPYGSFLWALFRYDIFGIFFVGGLLAATPWWWIEFPLLRLAGKRTVAYPYGQDARIPSATRELGRWNAYTDVPVGHEDSDERVIRRRHAVFGRFADVILGCADIAEDLPRVDGMYFYGIDTAQWPPSPSQEDRVVTVVHSPNHRHYKGTRFLLDAVETLKAEGVPIELVVIERLTNAEARRIYQQSDVVADQFLIGAYALLAIEAMALGKPVLCYLNPHFEPFHPEWRECPIISANPDTLVEQLRRVVEDADLRREAGRRGSEYVRKYHSLESVGARMDGIYRRLWWGESPS